MTGQGQLRDSIRQLPTANLPTGQKHGRAADLIRVGLGGEQSRIPTFAGRNSSHPAHTPGLHRPGGVRPRHRPRPPLTHPVTSPQQAQAPPAPSARPTNASGTHPRADRTLSAHPVATGFRRQPTEDRMPCPGAFAAVMISKRQRDREAYHPDRPPMSCLWSLSCLPPRTFTLPLPSPEALRLTG